MTRVQVGILINIIAQTLSPACIEFGSFRRIILELRIEVLDVRGAAVRRAGTVAFGVPRKIEAFFSDIFRRKTVRVNIALNLFRFVVYLVHVVNI